MKNNIDSTIIKSSNHQIAKSFKMLFFWLLALSATVLLLRNFVGETFYIPSGSMENELMTGDFIWVNKLVYGPRLPQFLNFMPYFRLPGFERVKRNDVLAFNYPNDDAVPVDKKTDYVKRCIGLPGDTLVIKDKTVYINSSAIATLAGYKYSYRVVADFDSLGSYLNRTMKVTEGGLISSDHKYEFLLTEAQADSVGKMSGVLLVTKLSAQTSMEDMFPAGKNFRWNNDYYGPIVIPKSGTTVHLNADSMGLYERLIRVYEKHKLAEQNDSIFIDGKYRKDYTFGMNYYFVMGDNRDHSEDSRKWGFVPEDHIIGKGSFIFFSLLQDPNLSFWNRINRKRSFRSVK